MIARKFLGWDKPLLEAACDWLLAEFSSAPDFGSCVIVVQGARAGRRLLQLLAARCNEAGAMLVPPRIVPVGKALREIFDEPPRLFPTASSLVQTLAWSRALEELPKETAALLGCHSTGSANTLRQARPLAATCSELGAHVRKPADVLPFLERSENATARTIDRWRAVQMAHDQYLATLKNWKTSDPTQFQIKLAQQGTPKPGLQVVLLGLVEFPPMIAQALERLETECLSLVYAPENESENFDHWGRIIPEKWAGREVPLSRGEIRCVENTEEQAKAVAELACEWTTEESRSGFVISAPDEGDVPLLCDALAEKGITARPSAVKKFQDTRPWQVLALLADYLDRAPKQPPGFSVVARMARHPDLARVLQAGPTLISSLDDWQGEHLPEFFAPDDAAYDPLAEGREELASLAARLKNAIPLSPGNQKAREIAGAVSAFLESVFGGLTEKRDVPEGRALIRPIEALLEELQTGVNAAPDLPMPPSLFIRALLDSRGNDPVPATFQQGASDIVGWLELLADDAPAAAVTSLCEGIVPESVTGDSLLPGRLRELLQLNHDAARLGRDAYLLTAIAQSRAGRLAVFVPRKNADGDPLRPGRLLLSGLDGDRLARRLIHLTSARVSTAPATAEPAPGADRLTAELPVEMPRLEKVSVSAFRDYLASPRLFYFKHVRKLNPADDHAAEIDGALQGTMIHAVCAAFGNREIKESSNEKEIRKWVLERLDQEAETRFAGLEPAIVKFQLESLRSRLGAFARVQAQERRAGWKIAYAENAGDDSEKLEGVLDCSDGGGLKIRGRIDRVDFNERENIWRVIDYKTGAKPKQPDELHYKKLKSGEVRWLDFQLPLYDLLIKKLAPRIPGFRDDDRPQLCYFLLPDDPGEAAVSEPFEPAMIEAGLEKAKVVAEKICAGDFQDQGKIRPEEDPVFRALCGLAGWVESDPEEEEPES
jgi:ATP-dependent helicase/nuclease subunit B